MRSAGALRCWMKFNLVPSWLRHSSPTDASCEATTKWIFEAGKGYCGTGKPAFKDERARVTAAIFWMKTRGGWSETSTHKHTGVANGDPIEVDVVTVRERLTRRIARIAAAGTTGDVPETDE